MLDSSLTNKKLIAGLYRFSTTIQDENKSFHKCYTREVLVSQLQFRKETTKFQFLCKKYTFQDSQSTAFIRKIAYVFDVLLLVINREGRIVNVENVKQLQRKWERLKEACKQDHGGVEFSNYLERVDQTIYNKEKLATFLESDKMYGMFLKGWSMYDHIPDATSEFIVYHTEGIIKLTESTTQDRQVQQYIFHDDVLQECIKIDDHLQFEILCLGLEK